MKKQPTVREAVLHALSLKRPKSYSAIAEQVAQKVPGSKPTPRSIASIASALRRDGLDLPDRRRHATT